jgi:hypothetical protein
MRCSTRRRFSILVWDLAYSLVGIETDVRHCRRIAGTSWKACHPTGTGLIVVGDDNKEGYYCNKMSKQKTGWGVMTCSSRNGVAGRDTRKKSVVVRDDRQRCGK